MKVWVISLSGEGKRVMLCAFAKREDAVAKMESIAESRRRGFHHTAVQLEEVDGLLVMAYYDEDYAGRYEEAVMTELEVTEDSNEKAVQRESKLVNDDWQLEELDF